MTKTQVAKAAGRYQWVEVALTDGTTVAGHFNRLSARYLNLASNLTSRNVSLARIVSVTPASREVAV